MRLRMSRNFWDIPYEERKTLYEEFKRVSDFESCATLIDNLLEASWEFNSTIHSQMALKKAAKYIRDASYFEFMRRNNG